MADTKFDHMVAETITISTAELTKAVNAPRSAIGLELYGTGATTPTWQFTPKLQRALYFDNSAATYTDATAELTSRLTADILTLNSLEATVDFLYFGCDTPFRGVRLNIGNTNTTASTDLAAFYWDAATWTGLTETDNTASGGISFAIDNTVTWTVPTDWVPTTVNGIGPHYWVRFNFDATFDSTVTLIEAVPLHIQTNRPASPATAAVLPRYWFNVGQVGGIEATGDNADTVVVTWLCTSRYDIFAAE